MDLKSATYSNVFGLKPHLGGVSLLTPYPLSNIHFTLLHWTRKVTELSLLLKRAGLWLQGLLECNWEPSLLAPPVAHLQRLLIVYHIVLLPL